MADGIRRVVRIKPEITDDFKSTCLDTTSPTELTVFTDLGVYPFLVDRVFDERTTQGDIFKVVGYPLLEDLLLGYSGSILCFGASCTGKTYTMTGSVQDISHMGLIPRSIHTLLDMMATKKASSSSLEYELSMSFVEVYMDKVIDLLSTTSSSQSNKTRPLPWLKNIDNMADNLKTNPSISEKIIETFDDFKRYYRMSHAKRVSGTSLRNNGSSTQSHFVVIVNVTQSLHPTTHDKEFVPGVYSTHTYIRTTHPLDDFPTHTPLQYSPDILLTHPHHISTQCPPNTHSSHILHRSVGMPQQYQTIRAKLMLVDLAGSEFAVKSPVAVSSSKVEEAKAINKSLSALSQVLSSLTHQIGKCGCITLSRRINNIVSYPYHHHCRYCLSIYHHRLPLISYPVLYLVLTLTARTLTSTRITETPSQHAPHIPYRNSKLTYLLRDCMGSPARTVLIINVSAAIKHSNETLSSLRFGCQSQSKVGYSHSHGHEESMSTTARHKGNISDRGNVSSMGNMSMSYMSGHSSMWGKGMGDVDETRRIRGDGMKEIGHHQHSQHHQYITHHSQNHNQNHSHNTLEQPHLARPSTTEDNATSQNEQALQPQQHHHQLVHHTTTTSHNTHHNTHHVDNGVLDPQQQPSDTLLHDHDTSIPSISVLGLEKDTVVHNDRTNVGEVISHGDAGEVISQSHRDHTSPTTTSSSPIQTGLSPGKKPSPVTLSSKRRKGPFVISGSAVDASQISGQLAVTNTPCQHTLSKTPHTTYTLSTPLYTTQIRVIMTHLTLL